MIFCYTYTRRTVVSFTYIKERIFMAIKITLGNSKGGVGKTTTTCLLAISLAKHFNQRVLVVDFDAQADSTDFLMRTFGVQTDLTNHPSIFDAIKSPKHAAASVLPLDDNLHIIPSGEELSGLDLLLFEKGVFGKFEAGLYLDLVVQQIEHDYDFILFDVPPTSNIQNINAIVASDYYIGVMMTQAKSYRQMAGFLKESDKTATSARNSKYGYEGAKLLGILMYLENKKSNIDYTVISAAIETYGDAILYSRVYERERVKRYDLIPPNPNKFDQHDKKIFAMYDSLAHEILMRVGQLAETEPKLRIQQLLEQAADDLNQQEYDTLAEALDAAQFYRDEIVEERDFTSTQLATALRDLFRDTPTQKRRVVIHRIIDWLQTEQDLKSLVNSVNV